MGTRDINTAPTVSQPSPPPKSSRQLYPAVHHTLLIISSTSPLTTSHCPTNDQPPILPSPSHTATQLIEFFGSCTSQLRSLLRPPLPIHQILQLLEREEDEDGGRLKTEPGGYPAFEHEHRTLVGDGLADDCHRRLFEFA